MSKGNWVSQVIYRPSSLGISGDDDGQASGRKICGVGERPRNTMPHPGQFTPQGPTRTLTAVRASVDQVKPCGLV